jgi:hypothetical protein
MPRPLSRRAVLRGAGGVTVGLPFLSAMLKPLQAHADTPVQKRLIVFFTPNGTVHDAWRPTGGERTFTLSPILAPLERHRDQLLILDGIDMRSALEYPGSGNGHDAGTGHSLTPWTLLQGPSGEGEFGHLWDGSAGGQSFDQYVAEHLGGAHPFSSLVWGVDCDIPQAIPSRISWKGPFDPVRPMQEPAAAFDRVFGSGADPAASLEETREQRLFVVDAVLQDYQRLYNRVGVEDRQRLNAHMESLFELERTVERLDLGSCTLPDRVDSANLTDIGRANLAMMAAAATCDLSPVLVHQWGSGQSDRTFTELGQTDSHHAMSHEPFSDTEAVAQLTAINRWFAERFADLLDHLAGTEAGDGSSLLDHSAVLWCNELGNAYIHEAANIPYVLAGGCGGALDTGRYLQFDYRGHGELFAAMGQALGLETESFGMPEVFTSPLTEILS